MKFEAMNSTWGRIAVLGLLVTSLWAQAQSQPQGDAHPPQQNGSAVLPPAQPDSNFSQPSGAYPPYPVATTSTASPPAPARPLTQGQKINSFLNRLAAALNAIAAQMQAEKAQRQAHQVNGSSPAYPGSQTSQINNTQPLYPDTQAPGAMPPSSSGMYPAADSTIPPAANPSPLPAYNAPPAAAQGQTFASDRRYYAMVNGSLEKWDFLHDGTFLHQGISAGAGTAVRGSQRGIYRIQGNVILLQINKTATAFATPGVSSEGGNTQLGGSMNNAPQLIQMSFQMIGPDGQNGIVLNGRTYKVRHWE